MRFVTRLALYALIILACPSRAQTPAAAPAPAPAAAATGTRIGGYVQLRATTQAHQGLTVLIQRARVSLDSALPNHVSTRVLVEFQSATGARTPATVSLREAVVRWAPSTVSFAAGQFKTPFSREYLIPVSMLETADFSPVVDSLAPKYDLGVMAEYEPAPWGKVSLGVFNGEGPNASVNRDSVSLWVARVVARPFAPVSLGANLARDSADSLRWGVEAELQRWGGLLRGEYMRRHRNDRPADLEDRGWYLFGSARVVPAVSCFARHGDFQRPAIGVSRRVRESCIGVNWECVPDRVRLLASVVRRTSGARQSDTRTWLAQLQVRF